VLRAQGKAQASIHCAKDELQYVPGTFLTNSGRLLVSVTRVKMAPLQLIQNRLLLTLRGRLRLGRAAGYPGTSPVRPSASAEPSCARGRTGEFSCPPHRSSSHLLLSGSV
jgi:hypothetical protein